MPKIGDKCRVLRMPELKGKVCRLVFSTSETHPKCRSRKVIRIGIKLDKPWNHVTMIEIPPCRCIGDWDTRAADSRKRSRQDKAYTPKKCRGGCGRPATTRRFDFLVENAYKMCKVCGRFKRRAARRKDGKRA